MPSLILALLFLAPGCSIKRIAVNSLADALAETSTVYSSDNDLELIGDATPFALKTMETLLAQTPKNRGLLVASAGAFVQYSYAFVQLNAEVLDASDPERSREQRLRAKRLYLRARDYGFRAIELNHANFRTQVRQDAKSALPAIKTKEVNELYWVTVAWAGAIACDKGDMDLVADLHLLEPMIHRCLELDEDFDGGTLHEFMVSFEGGRSASQGGSIERARKHFERAVKLSGRKKMSVLVALAENVSVQQENRNEFQELLQEVLAFDIDSAPDLRLANLVAQKKAKLLLSRIDDLFI